MNIREIPIDRLRELMRESVAVSGPNCSAAVAIRRELDRREQNLRTANQAAGHEVAHAA